MQQLQYPSLGGGFGHCFIKLIDTQPPILVLVDPDDHGGTSVTNAIEKVADLATKALNLAQWPRCVHYSRCDRMPSWVTFQDPKGFSQPRWKALTQSEIKLLRDHGIEFEPNHDI